MCFANRCVSFPFRYCSVSVVVLRTMYCIHCLTFVVAVAVVFRPARSLKILTTQLIYEYICANPKCVIVLTLTSSSLKSKTIPCSGRNWSIRANFLRASQLLTMIVIVIFITIIFMIVLLKPMEKGRREVENNFHLFIFSYE